MKITSIIRNRKVVLGTLGLAAALAVGIPVASAANASPAGPVSHTACVQHGKPNSVLGNWMLYDWNNSKCPAGTYGPVQLGGVTAPAPAPHVTKDFSTALSVTTGGPFVANSTGVGTVDLKAGTYLLSVNAKATPTGGSDPVFPQFFVYNQAKNSNFTGDVFNVGSGALAGGSTSLDGYFSGSTVITLATDTTLHVYAFGYSADKAGGTYNLDDLTVNAVPVP